MKKYKLSQICKSIENLFSEKVGNQMFWVIAELSKISYHNSGHTYLQLVETKDKRTIATIKSVLWKDKRNIISNNLNNEFDNIFKNGNEVLLQVKINFTSIYGLQFVINNLDLNYSIGNLERRKKETLKKLEEEKLIESNKLLILPLVYSKFIVIGARDSDGYKDFYETLIKKKNEYHFDFGIINTLVQGDNAALQICNAITSCQKYKNTIEAIIILRGGGSKLDLEPFNDYKLCKTIALSKIPVLTGIGHENDVSLADIVANKYFKTPTSVGEHIILQSYQFKIKTTEAIKSIQTKIHNIVSTNNEKLTQKMKSIHDVSLSRTGHKRHFITVNRNTIKSKIEQIFNNQNHFIISSFKDINASQLKISNLHSKSLNQKIEILKVKSGDLIKIKEKVRIESLFDKLKSYSSTYLVSYLSKLKTNEMAIKLLNPVNLINKGYAIIYDENGIFEKKTKLFDGKQIKIKIYDKVFLANIQKILDNGNNII